MLATKMTKAQNSARSLPAYRPTDTHAMARRTAMNKTSKEKLKWMGTVVICTVIGTGLVYRYAEIAQANLAVEEMKQQVMDKQDEVAKLTKVKQDLERPSRIISIAKEKLGMVLVNSPLQGGQGRE